MVGWVVYYVFVIVQLCVAVNNAEMADWTPYIVVDGMTESDSLRTDSVNIVSKVPLFYYWDVEKSAYSMGVIGSELTSDSLFSPYLSIMDKKVVRNRVVETIPNVTVVDIDALYMNTLVAIQHLANASSTLNSELSVLQEEKLDFAKKIIRIADETGKEWRTASEIRSEREIVEMRMKLVEAKLEKQQGRDVWLEENRIFRAKERRELRYKQHLNLTLLRKTEIDRSQLQNEHKYVVLHDLAADPLSLSDDDDALEEYSTAHLKDHYEDRIRLSVEAIQFRSTEESRIYREENADVHEHLVQARDSALREKTNRLIDVIFVEVGGECVRFVSEVISNNPLAIVSGGVVGFLILTLIILVMEGAILYRSILLQKWAAARAPVRHSPPHPTHTPSTDVLSQYRFGSMVVSTHLKVQLTHLVDLFERMYAKSSAQTTDQFVDSSMQQLPQPHVLVVGTGGSGKSLISQELMTAVTGRTQHASAPSVRVKVIQGKQLRTLGSEEDAALALRKDLLECSAPLRENELPWLVVIDDADEWLSGRGCTSSLPNDVVTSNVSSMVTSNDQPHTNTTSSGGNGMCLYMLLASLRTNSPQLGVIITSNSSNTSHTNSSTDRGNTNNTIDPAFLDRLDMIITLTSPSAVLRAIYAMDVIRTLIVPMTEKTVFGSGEGSPLDNECVKFLSALDGFMSDNQMDDKARNAEVATSSLACGGDAGDDKWEMASVTSVSSIASTGSTGSRKRRGRPSTVPAIPRTPSRRSLRLPPLDTELDSTSTPVVQDTPRTRSMRAAARNINVVDMGGSESVDINRDMNGSSMGAGRRAASVVSNNYQIATVDAMWDKFVAQYDMSSASASALAFHPVLCVLSLVASSNGWSFRSIHKFINNIQCDALGTESCEITTELWEKAITRAVQFAHNSGTTANTGGK